MALPAGAVLRDWQSLMDSPSGGPALLAVEGQGAGAAPRFDVFRNDGNMPLFQISLLVGGLREFKILERGLGDTPKVKLGCGYINVDTIHPHIMWIQTPCLQISA